jgi:hypothetical protein
MYCKIRWTMAKKRLVIDLNEENHRILRDKARAEDITIANYVRRALGLPQERQGVKAEAPKKRAPRKKES